jgi:hypothetical protein
MIVGYLFHSLKDDIIVVYVVKYFVMNVVVTLLMVIAMDSMEISVYVTSVLIIQTMVRLQVRVRMDPRYNSNCFVNSNNNISVILDQRMVIELYPLQMKEMVQIWNFPFLHHLRCYLL